MPSAIDPTFPADGTPVSKPAFRDQLMTLRAELEHGGFVTNPVTLAESTTSQALADVHAATVPARVGTIAELQAIPPAPGLTVEVLGYHAPGDGGGGLFYADMTGALETDGGIVFGCTADQSAVQTESGKTAGNFQSGFSLAQANLVFGSVTVDPGLGTTASDLDLHGHRTNNANPVAPYIDHAAGTFSGTAGISNYLSAKATTATVTYRYYINARRWVRQTDGRVLDARWFGLTGSGDERNLICWALNAAKRLAYTEVRLNGSYNYLGSIEIPGGIDFGWGKLIVTAGVLEHLRTDYGTIYPNDRTLGLVGGSGDSTAIHPASNALYVGLHSLEIDGNYQANTAPLENTAAYARDGASVQNLLQNTPLWSAWSGSNHGGRVIPAGQRILVEDVHFHGVGSNCMVGHGNATYYGSKVRLGNSARNHLFYSCQGEFTQLTFYGFAWGVYGKCEHLNVDGFRFEDRALDFPFTQDGWTMAPQVFFYEGIPWGTTVETSHRFQRIGVALNGVHVDLGNWSGTDALFPGQGHHFHMSNVLVLGSLIGTSETRLTQKYTAGGNTDLEGWSFENITLLQRGGSRLTFAGNSPDLHAQVRVTNLSVSELRGYEGLTPGNANHFAEVRAEAKLNGQNANYPRLAVFEHIRLVAPAFQFAFEVDVTDADPTPVEVVLRDSVLNLSTSTIYKNLAGQGTLATMTIQDTDPIRFSWENVRFKLNLNFPQNLEMFFAMTRFRSCKTFDGLVSEAGGILSLIAAGGEASIDVATNLFWEPAMVHIGARSPAASARFAYAEVLAGDGASAIDAVADKRAPVLRLHFDQPLSAGDDVQLAWDAAVRPF